MKLVNWLDSLECGASGRYNREPELRSGKLVRVQRNKTQSVGSGQAAESRAKVRYAETDQMGVAYYANYFVWFEVGRSQYCNNCGFSYRDMERETGLFLIVAEASCRYKNPARYEDELIIRTRIAELTRRTLRFTYEIDREDGTLVATGETLHVLINGEGRPSSFPEKYLSLLRAELA
ncbi:MAG TPA: thioesterase family protein [Blastocatellia bacterium]|nr:thioesterase family protein [Blastocatellia bacterium]